MTRHRVPGRARLPHWRNFSLEEWVGVRSRAVAFSTAVFNLLSVMSRLLGKYSISRLQFAINTNHMTLVTSIITPLLHSSVYSTLLAGNIMSVYVDATTSNTTVTTTTTTTTSLIPYCPVNHCIDNKWFTEDSKNNSCIYPHPQELGRCWDAYCATNVNRPSLHINETNNYFISYCKSWQTIAGRLCYANDTLTCLCSTFNITSPIYSSNDIIPDGHIPGIYCEYPTITTITIVPTTPPFFNDDDAPSNTAINTYCQIVISILITWLLTYSTLSFG